ncbi:TetR/AcrR family transcriptional regulator [Macrococcus lamae]|uniref:TetR family transcriptional regulator n=1 Tax=Macrococcus lamae TaxID=198484 RepID=A0A4V3BET4_9STAP|nr:TetR/AcrR family transcriptional regulator C-terminal domain-containing protein [Macrococcus lamae]TDM07707.1 TetR family transcriptional regulator [Macrococcus lamae]
MDRRIRKTQQTIQQAFFKLLQQESFKEVTVQQIADSTDINRSTFYAHYLDKYDLLEKIEDALIADIFNSINTETYDGTQLTANLVEQIDEHMPWFELLFKMGRDSEIQDKLYTLVYQHLETFKDIDDTIGHIPFSYFMSYAAGAGLSLISHWIKDDHRIPKEDLIRYFNEIIINGPGSIVRQNIKES